MRMRKTMLLDMSGWWGLRPTTSSTTTMMKIGSCSRSQVKTKEKLILWVLRIWSVVEVRGPTGEDATKLTLFAQSLEKMEQW